MPSASCSVRLLAVWLLAIVPASAFGAWAPGGVPLTSGSFNFGHTVIEDGAGGVMTFWSQPGPLLASRVVADGTPSPGLPLAGAQVGSLTFMAPFTGAVRAGGDVFVAAHNPFLASPNHGLQMFRLHADGTTAFGWPDTGNRVYETDRDLVPRFDADGLGGVVVAWFERHPTPVTFPVTSVYDLRAQRVGGDGSIAPGWPSTGVAISLPPAGTTPVLMTFDLGVARDGTGGLFVAWQDSTDGLGDIYVQRIDADGNIASGWPADGRAVCSVASRKHQLQIAADGAGGAYLAWAENRPPGFAAFLTRIGPDGQTMPGWPTAGLQISGAGVLATLGRLVADGSGGAIVGYLEYHGGQPDVYAKRVLSDAAVAPGWGSGVAVAANAAGEDLAGLLPDGAGGAFFLVGGATGSSSEHQSLSVLALTGSGLPSPGLPPAGMLVTTDQVAEAKLLPAEPGAAIATWRVHGASPIDLRGSKVEVSLPTPVQASLVSASAEPGRVRIEWLLSEAGAIDVGIERRAGAEGWEAMGRAAVDGGGRVVFEDLDAPTGPVRYRMVAFAAGGEIRLGEVEVSVPAPYAFALGVQPNPAPRGRLTVAITLPASGPSRIDVLDIAGRAVFGEDLGGLGPGPHLRELEGRFAPGVYLVRLSQGGAQAMRRAVVIE